MSLFPHHPRARHISGPHRGFGPEHGAGPQPRPRRPRRAARRSAALETLYDVGRALGSTLDFEAVLQRVLELSRSTIGSETASVMLADEATGDLVLACAQGLPKEAQPGMRLPGGGIAEWVYRNGAPVQLHGSPTRDPRFRNTGSREHIRSALSVPLVGKRGPIGVLSLNNSVRRKAFTLEDLDLLTAIGTQAGIAVENARLHRCVEEANRQLTITVEHLRNIKFALNSMTGPDMNVSLQTIVDAAVEGTGAQAGSLTVLDEGDGGHVIEASYHGDGIRLPPGGPATWKDAEAAILAASARLHQATGDPSHAMLCVLTAKGKPIGLLKLITAPSSPGFNEDDREFVNALVEHAATVLFNSMLYQEAQAGREALQKAYADLQDKQDQLIQSEKLAAIGHLAARICHEINNPLTAISGCTQLMQRKLRAENARLSHREAYDRYLQTIATETERCSCITGDLLRFARQPELRCAEADLHHILSHALSLIEFKYPEGLQISADFDFQMEPLVADPQQLTQVFLNLLTNAAEAMPQGGPLEVGTACLTAPGRARYVRVDIRDAGTGIGPDAAARLFDPFFTTKSTGTGLGLTICKSIVEKHRGLLSLSPAPERGTVATVILPLNTPAAPERPDPALLGERSGATVSLLGGRSGATSPLVEAA